MDLTSIGIVGVGSITVLCYLVGEGIKATKMDNKWIPLICGGAGMILGILAMHIMPEFPATDYITAAATGVISGLAATGINQVVKQLNTKE